MAINSDIVTISCGPVLARLHHRAFLCPGIHQECIELNDGTMVTPKSFSLMGDKGRLKDWKNAIRINGLSLRKRMEMGDIDFYNHTDSCTGRCASRHVGNSKYEAKIENLKMAQEQDLISVPALLTGANLGEHAYTVLQEVQAEKDGVHLDSGKVVVKSEPPSDYGDEPAVQQSSPTFTRPSTSLTPAKVMVKGASKSSAAPVAQPMLDAIYDFPETGDILKESQSFWKFIMDIGLLDPFVREIKTALDGMKNDLRRGHDFEETSKKMSQIVTDLGLVTKLKFRLAQHKTETEKQKLSLVQEIEALRRKVAETEQKQRELKRKSECFEQLMEMGRSSKKARKAPRGVASSGDDALPSSGDDDTGSPVPGDLEGAAYALAVSEEEQDDEDLEEIADAVKAASDGSDSPSNSLSARSGSMIVFPTNPL